MKCTLIKTGRNVWFRPAVTLVEGQRLVHHHSAPVVNEPYLC